MRSHASSLILKEKERSATRLETRLLENVEKKLVERFRPSLPSVVILSFPKCKKIKKLIKKSNKPLGFPRQIPIDDIYLLIYLLF